MSNFFESIKGAASNIKNVASSYAKDIVNEYMEGEEDEEEHSEKKKKELEENVTKSVDVNPPKDALKFFASFLPDIDPSVEVKQESPKSSTNPFDAFKVQAQNANVEVPKTDVGKQEYYLFIYHAL
jgi:hypothetical protein